MSDCKEIVISKKVSSRVVTVHIHFGHFLISFLFPGNTTTSEVQLQMFFISVMVQHPVAKLFKPLYFEGIKILSSWFYLGILSK